MPIAPRAEFRHRRRQERVIALRRSPSRDNRDPANRSADGRIWRQSRIPKWRATADEDGHYRFAVPL
jgi:hypothetical protein